MKLPEYSVIIPAYQCRVTIHDTIKSALQQTHLPTEIIIIDDTSVDGTWEYLQTLAAQIPLLQIYRNSRNLGVAATRSRGFALATTPYIALLDADDLWHTEKSEQQLRAMLQQEADFSYTSYTFCDQEGHILPQIYDVPDNITYKSMLAENVIGCSTVILKTNIARKYQMNGNYLHEDYLYWLTLLQHGYNACGITKPLMTYRLSAQGRSANKVKSAKERWRIYRKELGLGMLQSTYYWLQYVWSGFKKYYQ